jgi:hypothetical protein
MGNSEVRINDGDTDEHGRTEPEACKARNRSKRIQPRGHLKVDFARVPGPGARTLWAKPMRRPRFHGSGGPTILAPPWRFSLQVGGDRSVARSARLILRKPTRTPGERAHPPDAFYPQGPCPRATTRHPGIVNPPSAIGGDPR